MNNLQHSETDYQQNQDKHLSTIEESITFSQVKTRNIETNPQQIRNNESINNNINTSQYKPYYRPSNMHKYNSKGNFLFGKQKDHNNILIATSSINNQNPFTNSLNSTEILTSINNSNGNVYNAEYIGQLHETIETLKKEKKMFQQDFLSFSKALKDQQQQQQQHSKHSKPTKHKDKQSLNDKERYTLQILEKENAELKCHLSVLSKRIEVLEEERKQQNVNNDNNNITNSKEVLSTSTKNSLIKTHHKSQQQQHHSKLKQYEMLACKQHSFNKLCFITKPNTPRKINYTSNNSFVRVKKTPNTSRSYGILNIKKRSNNNNNKVKPLNYTCKNSPTKTRAVLHKMHPKSTNKCNKNVYINNIDFGKNEYSDTDDQQYQAQFTCPNTKDTSISESIKRNVDTYQSTINRDSLDSLVVQSNNTLPHKNNNNIFTNTSVAINNVDDINILNNQIRNLELDLMNLTFNIQSSIEKLQVSNI